MADAAINIEPEIVPITTAEFATWYAQQPDGERYELCSGVVYRMQAERLAHARMKFRVAQQLASGVAAKRLPCETLGDGMAVRIDGDNQFEPDALVRCGPRLPDDTVVLDDPIIVVEVTSPSTQHLDVLMKFMRYFNNPRIVHYVIVMMAERGIIHHRRADDGQIISRSHEAGVVHLDPPGLVLDVDELFRQDESVDAANEPPSA